MNWFGSGEMEPDRKTLGPRFGLARSAIEEPSARWSGLCQVWTILGHYRALIAATIVGLFISRWIAPYIPFRGLFGAVLGPPLILFVLLCMLGGCALAALLAIGLLAALFEVLSGMPIERFGDWFMERPPWLLAPLSVILVGLMIAAGLAAVAMGGCVIWVVYAR